MSDFLNQMRHLQQETKKKMISPDEVYEKLNEFQLDTALNQIKRMIAEDCQKNPDSRVLKGRYMLFCGGRVARIDQTPDTINEYYRIILFRRVAAGSAWTMSASDRVRKV